MAVSSIFHNVVLRTPEQVEAFIRAAEASEADTYVKPAGAPTYKVASSEDIRELLELREKSELKK